MILSALVLGSGVKLRFDKSLQASLIRSAV